MSVHALIDSTGLVANVIEYDPQHEFDPGEGFSLVGITAPTVSVGWTYEGGRFTAPKPEPIDPIDLDVLKGQLKKQIDAAAEAERLKYITAGAGQAMTYQEKFAELVRYEADSDPVKVNYPMMSAEIGITGASLTAVAAAIRGAYDLWKQIGGAIEIARLQAKSAVDKATTEDRVRAASEVTWPAP